MHPAQAKPLQPHAQPLPIPEDSPTRKFLSCIPIFGIFVGRYNEFSLLRKIRASEDPQRTIDLIDVKIEYKGASIVRNLLSAAAFVAFIALGVFAKSAFLVVGICTGLAAYRYYQILQIHKTQDDIDAHGLRPGLRVL